MRFAGLGEGDLRGRHFGRSSIMLASATKATPVREKPRPNRMYGYDFRPVLRSEPQDLSMTERPPIGGLFSFHGCRPMPGLVGLRRKHMQRSGTERDQIGRGPGPIAPPDAQLELPSPARYNGTYYAYQVEQSRCYFATSKAAQHGATSSRPHHRPA